MKWIVGIVAVLAASLALQTGLIAFAMYVLLGVLLLSRYLAKTWITGLAAERECESEPLEVGDQVEVVVRIRNTNTTAVPWVLVEDLLPRDALSQRPPRVQLKGKRLKIATVRGGKTTELKYKITFQTRGYYQIGPAVLETGDLFGLHRRHRVVTKPTFVLVYPKVLPLPKYDFASMRPIGEVHLAHRLFEDPTRTSGVRPYQVGDPLNRVHWRATARTGELHSRVFEPTSLAGASILVDFHSVGYPRKREPYRSELAVTLAASLAYAVSMQNQQIGFASNGRDAVDRIRIAAEAGPASADGHPTDPNTEEFFSRQAARAGVEVEEQSDRLRPLVVETRRGVEQFQRIREALARLELTDGMTFAGMVFEVAPRLPRDATVIAVLPAVSIETSLALGSLRRLGFAVSALLVGIDDEEERVQAQGRLVAEGVRDVRHVANETELALLGQQNQSTAATYALDVPLA